MDSCDVHLQEAEKELAAAKQMVTETNDKIHAADARWYETRKKWWDASERLAGYEFGSELDKMQSGPASFAKWKMLIEVGKVEVAALLKAHEDADAARKVPQRDCGDAEERLRLAWIQFRHARYAAKKKLISNK